MTTPIREAGGMRPVIQADRDAAADHILSQLGEHDYLRDIVAEIRGGNADASKGVQAMAAHREASTAELVEALTEVTVLLDGINSAAPRRPSAYIDAALCRANALLAQHEGSAS